LDTLLRVVIDRALDGDDMSAPAPVPDGFQQMSAARDLLIVRARYRRKTPHDHHYRPDQRSRTRNCC